MTSKFDFSKLNKHGIPVGLFLLVFVILFHPAIFSGKTLPKHDIQQWEASAKAITDFRERTGEEPLWTNSMFSGMPATLVSTLYTGDLLHGVLQVINFYRPYTLILIACICFYILLQTFRVEPMISAIGAVCYSCSSYVIIGMIAGHSSRIAAIAFLPLVVAGFNLIFKGKYRWGFVATAIGLALEIKVNHLQITYYLALALVIFSIHHLVVAIKKKDASFYTTKIPILLVAVSLAVGSNFGRLWNIADYGKYSTRGKSELSNQGSGLEKDYIFEFSNSIAEPLVLFIPNFFGGSSQEELSKKSNLAQALRDNGVPRSQVSNYIQSVPTYWGKQRLTAPYYAGAIAVFLAVLGIVVLRRKEKVWLIIVTALGIVLSWGDNFESFNYFLFNNLPGYNKFRSVTFTILLAIFGISMLASLGLQRLLSEKEGKIQIKPLIIATLATGGFALLAAIFAGIGKYAAPVDETLLARQTPQWFIDALREDRASLLRKDALRSAFYIISSAVIIFLISKEKLSKQLGLIILLGLTMLDVILIDKRYLNSSSFIKNKQAEFTKSQADEYILSQAKAGERVLNVLNPFNDATTSYHHESVGGYHGAKIGRYRELIENHLSGEIQEYISRIRSGDQNTEDLDVLNMLNTKFFKLGDAPQQVLQNLHANGNAWFVKAIGKVNSANEEIAALHTIDTKETAAIDVSKFEGISDFQISNSIATVELTDRDLNKSTYEYTSDGDGLIVFSDIYYPKGWVASIDGEEINILRANYVLRALEVPPGEHTITFEYKPEIYYTGNTIMLIFGILLYVSTIGIIVYPMILKSRS